MAIGRSRIEYRVLRGLGASPEEALQTLLGAACPDPASQAFILAMNLPGNLDPECLWGLLCGFNIHPLSLVLHLGDRRRALRVLRRLGLEEVYSRWLAPWGLHIHDEPDLKALPRGLHIHDEPDLKALPRGLVIDGEARIEDCPALVDLGENLVVTGGTLLVCRCNGLQRLPDGLTTDLSGHITLIDCPRIEHLGAQTNFEGVLFVQGCPRFQDQHLTQRHTLEE